MTIYPAIDIKGGRCVRLTQGRADQETVYAENPADVAASFKAAGSEWVHVVDLDGAFEGEPRNLHRVSEVIAQGMKVQLGGGMRTRASVEKALTMGVTRVVIGTRAAESEAFIRDLVLAFGDRIAVGIDAKNGKVAVKGWVDTTALGAITLAKRMSDLGVATIIHTDVGTDGMLTGPNIGAQAAMCAGTKSSIIASGGVSRIEDVRNLQLLSAQHTNLHGVIIGKAIYEGKIDLSELFGMNRKS